MLDRYYHVHLYNDLKSLIKNFDGPSVSTLVEHLKVMCVVPIDYMLVNWEVNCKIS